MPVARLSFSPDSRRLASAGTSGALESLEARLWNVETGQPIGSPLAHSAGIDHVAFSPDGRVVITSGSDNCACLWDSATGRRL